MSGTKSNFTARVDNSVQDKVRALAKQEGQSINKTTEKLLIEALRARADSDIENKGK